MRARLTATLALALAGCFGDLDDRRCVAGRPGDCFAGEACVGGSCLAVVGAPGAEPVAIRVDVRTTADPERPVAGVASADADDGCQCRATADAPCVFELEAGAARTVCGGLAGHQACRVTLPAVDVVNARLVSIVAAPCPAEGACTELPTCDCEDLPPCAEE